MRTGGLTTKRKVWKGLWHGCSRWRYAAATAVTLAAQADGRAQTYTWVNPSDGSWSNAENWLGTATPSSGSNTVLNFNGNGPGYTATDDLGSQPFVLGALNFGQSGGNVTIGDTAGGNNGLVLSLSGLTPSITVSGTGNATILYAINNNNSNATPNVNLPVSLNITGSGSLTLAGALGGSLVNGNQAYGFAGAGTGSGTLAFAGGGTTGFWWLGNANTVVSGGTYTLASTSGDNPTTLQSSLVVGRVANQPAYLSVTGGSTLAAVNGSIGWFSNTAGNVSVSSLGTSVTANGTLNVAGYGTGCLSVTGGATLQAALLNVARLTGGNGSILVDGAGSALNVANVSGVLGSGQVLLGYQGLGTLTVQNGGKFTARALFDGVNGSTGNASDAGNGVVSVAGSGSSLVLGGTAVQNSAGQLTVANGLTGSVSTVRGRLAIASGGSVDIEPSATAGTGTLNSALQPNAAANITIDGTGTQLTVANSFSLGGSGGASNGGSTTLSVTAGGLVRSGQGGGFTYFGRNAVSNTTVTVDGSGSQFLVAGGQLQTNLGTSLIKVQNGGNLTVYASVVLGNSTASNTTLAVSGANSLLYSAGTFQTNVGTVSATVSGGGNLTAVTYLILGAVAGNGNATLTVDGPGSAASVGSQLQLNYGTSRLNVQNFGNVTVGSAAFVGTAAGSNAAISATGNGSFNVAGGLSLAGAGGTPGGTAALTVSGGGSANVGGTLSLYGGGTLNVNAGGNLSLGGLVDGSGSSTGAANVQTGGTLQIAYVGKVPLAYDGPIAGGGSIAKSGAGTVVFGGNNSFYGSLALNGGVFAVANVAGSGTGSATISVNGGGTLAGSGAVAGNVTVLADGTLTGGYIGTAKLTIGGNTLLKPGSVASIGINGNAPGSGYDQLVLGNTGVLTLGTAGNGPTLTTGLGYVPAAGDIISFVTGSATGGATQVIGQFANAPDGAILSVGSVNGDLYQATIHYTSQSIYLDSFQPAPVPEPGHVLGLGAAAGAAVGWRRRRAR